jgi:hypothetical protein
MTSERLLHHLVKDRPGLDERLVHGDQIGSLLAVLVNELYDLRSDNHARPIQFLDLLVIRKIILRRVYILEHVQQSVNICSLGEHRSLLFRFVSQLSRSQFWQRFDVVDRENAGPPPQLSPPPVLITPIDDLDNVTTVERELSRFGRFKGMQRSYASDQH